MTDKDTTTEPACAAHEDDNSMPVAELVPEHAPQCEHPDHHKPHHVSSSISDHALAETKEIVKLIKEVGAKPEEVQSLEAQAALEKTRLQVWLIKTLVWFLAFLTVGVVAAVAYATATDTDIIIPAFVMDVVNSFKEIVMAIVEIK